MFARLGRLFLVFAVLLAQQTALVHQLSHVGMAQATEAQRLPLEPGDRLCDLHDLLGTVLGMACAAPSAQAVLAFGAAAFIGFAAARADAALPAAKSRGPPQIS